MKINRLLTLFFILIAFSEATVAGYRFVVKNITKDTIHLKATQDCKHNNVVFDKDLAPGEIVEFTTDKKGIFNCCLDKLYINGEPYAHYYMAFPKDDFNEGLITDTLGSDKFSKEELTDTISKNRQYGGILPCVDNAIAIGKTYLSRDAWIKGRKKKGYYYYAVTVFGDTKKRLFPHEKIYGKPNSYGY